VIYGKYSGSDIEVDGHEVKILRESDILAKVMGWCPRAAAAARCGRLNLFRHHQSNVPYHGWPSGPPIRGV